MTYPALFLGNNCLDDDGMNRRHLLGVLAITQHAFTCRTTNELRQKVLQLLQEAFRAAKSGFFLVRHNPTRIDLVDVVNNGIEEHYLRLFRQHYYRHDPFLKSYRQTGTVVTTRQIVRFEVFEKTDYYREFLRPQSIHYQMVIQLHSDRQLLGTIGLFRPRRMRDFSSFDFMRAKLMAPYLAAALEKTLIADDSCKYQHLIRSICLDVPYAGVIALDKFLDPIFIDEEALKVLSDSSEPDQDRIAALPDELLAICGEFRDRVGTENAWADVVLRTGGRHLPIHLRMNCDSDEKLLLVYVKDHASGRDLSEKLRRLGLTRREQELAHLVCQGLRNGEIAEKLFISEYTVQNHLQSIYQKMNVKNRTRLAYRLCEFINPGTPTARGIECQERRGRSYQKTNMEVI